MREMEAFSNLKKARTVAIGVQDFESLIIKNNFYVDKTNFIKEWWESDDAVTLIMRPRRFGKTLNMNYVGTVYNLNIVDMTSMQYADAFGFTEEEVFTAMSEFGLTNRNEVKRWYDGFAKNASSRDNPERFYHGFVLGLIVDLSDRYQVISNRESGFGRYDVVLKPLDKTQDAIIIEFKVHKPNRESSLEETVQSALKQIEDKRYDADLLTDGIQKECIRKYGFAFKGKEVLIGSGIQD